MDTIDFNNILEQSNIKKSEYYLNLQNFKIGIDILLENYKGQSFLSSYNLKGFQNQILTIFTINKEVTSLAISIISSYKDYICPTCFEMLITLILIYASFVLQP